MKINSIGADFGNYVVSPLKQNKEQDLIQVYNTERKSLADADFDFVKAELSNKIKESNINLRLANLKRSLNGNAAINLYS